MSKLQLCRPLYKIQTKLLYTIFFLLHLNTFAYSPEKSPFQKAFLKYFDLKVQISSKENNYCKDNIKIFYKNKVIIDEPYTSYYIQSPKYTFIKTNNCNDLWIFFIQQDLSGAYFINVKTKQKFIVDINLIKETIINQIPETTTTNTKQVAGSLSDTQGNSVSIYYNTYSSGLNFEKCKKYFSISKMFPAPDGKSIFIKNHTGLCWLIYVNNLNDPNLSNQIITNVQILPQSFLVGYDSRITPESKWNTNNQFEFGLYEYGGPLGSCMDFSGRRKRCYHCNMHTCDMYCRSQWWGMILFQNVIIDINIDNINTIKETIIQKNTDCCLDGNYKPQWLLPDFYYRSSDY